MTYDIMFLFFLVNFIYPRKPTFSSMLISAAIQLNSYFTLVNFIYVMTHVLFVYKVLYEISSRIQDNNFFFGFEVNFSK